jgi:hypothetical protein
MIDSLDTLLVAGLSNEYREARDWIVNHLTFDVVYTSQPASMRRWLPHMHYVTKH